MIIKFKIDLIVWKLDCKILPVLSYCLFKIDLIVWKLVWELVELV